MVSFDVKGRGGKEAYMGDVMRIVPSTMTYIYGNAVLCLAGLKAA